MRHSPFFLTILAAAMLGGCAVEPTPAPAGESPISASKIYIDSDSDRALDKNVVIAPTGTTPATDGLDITAPGGVNVTAGALTVEAGALSVVGDGTFSKIEDADRFIRIKNSSAGSSASVSLILQTTLAGSGTKVLEMRGVGYASGAGDLRINIPEGEMVDFYSTSGAASLARVDDTDGFVAPTVTAEDQVVIEGLGSTSAPAIHFTEGSLPADVGFRVESSSGRLIYRTNGVDCMKVAPTFISSPGYFLVTNGSETLYAENGFTADLGGYNTGLYFVPADERWVVDYYIKAPGVLTPPQSTNLTADDQSISVAGKSYVLIDSDNATASNRTFAISAGDEAGHRVVLQFAPSGAYACELRDDTAITGGAIRLTADWEPADYGTLSLIYDGADWIEMGRTAP